MISGASATIGNNTTAIIDGTVGLTKLGAGTLTLNGSATHTFSGGLNVNAGTLALAFANMADSTSLVASQALGFGGGNLTLKATTGAIATTQTLGTLTVNAGGGSLLINPNAGTSTTLTLDTLTATAAGGSLTLGTALSAGSGPLTLTTTTNKDAVTGIYGGRIVFASGTAGTGYDWATTAAVAAPYALAAYTGYAALAASGTDTSNSRITASLSLSGALTTNSLKIENPAASQSMGLGANLLTLTGGGQMFGFPDPASGLLVTGTNATSISGTAGATRLTAADGSGAYDLIVNQYNSGGLTISAVIGDNVAGSTHATSLTKAGSGTLSLSGANTYSGVTYVNAGSLYISNATSLGTSAGEVRASFPTPPPAMVPSAGCSAPSAGRRAGR